MHALLLCQQIDHALDLIDLILGRDARHGESIAHACTLASSLRHTVNQAELRWQELFLLTNLHKEAGLVEVGHFLVVNLHEVLGKLDRSTIPEELISARSSLEVHIIHIVGALVAPVSHNGAS